MKPDKNIFDRYLLALRKTPIDDKTEHTDRSALENLLQAIAEGVADDLVVHQETKQKRSRAARVEMVRTRRKGVHLISRLPKAAR